MRSLLAYTKDVIKLFFLFILCTSLFYFGLQAIHQEYEDYHRYDAPEGNAVKVNQQTDYQWIDRISIFFRLGE
ncbi:hypothetical protein BN1058_01022 [Paraliobacillus sp. PM-2]|uniref:DUF4227 family protein n=1 Tax=Paraliobacillus sp. PM-2 TaxID=1462524 RepID=UPI00061BD7E7|nr:DUF4227 family protein [Paraliobacillus sp. PM-2]CQR46748.1 hypothetical protein BN1058_01022 [Paraliobacillus sp. PM-2]